jgi:uncharacterized lipoprotein YmbA
MMLTALWLLSGCASTPSAQFYTLSAASSAPATMRTGSAPCRDVPVTLGALHVAQYLDRNQIVTRTNAYEVEVSEFHRWAGSLPDDFARVLSRDLAVALDNARGAAAAPQQPSAAGIRLDLRLDQLDGRLADTVALDVTWHAVDVATDAVLAMHREQFTEPVNQPGYGGLVAAYSDAVAKMAISMAAPLGDVCSALTAR